MKKTLLIVGIILAVILALPVINLIRWTLEPKKPMGVILVDKTVPNFGRENHKSFNWVLTNDRFVKKDTKRSYSYLKDYYGFFPKRPLRDKNWDRNDYRLTELISLAEKNDAVYFSDTYGVFFSDWFRGINKSRKSRKIYGGLNNNDFLLIKEMKDRNKLIIMEYNAFDYPTAQFESVRTQEKLGISFSGWTGKYFNSLDTTSADFPTWMTAIYRKQYKKSWTFNKPGIVILKEKDIIVLEEGAHLKNSIPHVITDASNCEKFGVTTSVAFDKWFDIIDPEKNNVLSQFKIETTALGDTLLASNGLSSEFPAVIQDAATQRIYYFSGDFANGEVPMWASRLKGFPIFNSLFYSDKPDDPRRFFWLYYRPLINGIFSDYYVSMKK
ncbi:MAG TPA: hypothetical protein PLR88_05010 [Bacteroidales bacterium]|nr:hypothetical protein [Bacteroidales bacterium]